MADPENSTTNDISLSDVELGGDSSWMINLRKDQEEQ